MAFEKCSWLTLVVKGPKAANGVRLNEIAASVLHPEHRRSFAKCGSVIRVVWGGKASVI
jgi:hypothetical protein